MKTSPRPASERVSWCLETSSITTPFPGLVSIPNSFVSLFIFYILPYLLSKTMGCFSGRLMTSASDQKLFCAVYSVFKCSFDEFVGEKVVSPSYSSTILAPPPNSPSLILYLLSILYLQQSNLQHPFSLRGGITGFILSLLLTLPFLPQVSSISSLPLLFAT